MHAAAAAASREAPAATAAARAVAAAAVRQLLRPVQRLLADQRPSACGKSGSTPTSGLHVKGMRGCVRRPTMKTKWLVRPRLKKEEKMDTGDAAKKEELEGETKNEDAMN
jgi:hypothetical protein